MGYRLTCRGQCMSSVPHRDVSPCAIYSRALSGFSVDRRTCVATRVARRVDVQLWLLVRYAHFRHPGTYPAFRAFAARVFRHGL